MGWLRRCGWLGALGAATGLSALLILAAQAQAAFPGRDGWLAVQPLKGSGLVLISADGRGERRVCTGCGVSSPNGVLRPQWAPDGRSLVIGTYLPPGSVWEPFTVIYPDGSCLACSGGSWTWSTDLRESIDPAFTNNPTLLTAVTPSQETAGDVSHWALVEYGVDGLARKVLLSGQVSDPVWSSRGGLALVRDGWIWVGSPRKLRRLARGSAPSWSPLGGQIVFERRGWLMIGGVRGRLLRRLVRGTAPAWSPDGVWIAFFDKRHRLSVVRAGGGRVRRVAGVTGRTVDWQPLPAQPPGACSTPPGSTVLASSDTAIITADRVQSTSPYSFFTSAYMGCLRAEGRAWLLARYQLPGYEFTAVTEAVVAGAYAALATNTVYVKPPDTRTYSGVEVFDLRTGAEFPNRGGEQASCPGISTPPCATADQLVLGSDAVSALHTTVKDYYGTVEQIQASDSMGLHTLDSTSEPDGSPSALTNLTLTGDILTWEHNGTPRSAQLQS